MINSRKNHGYGKGTGIVQRRETPRCVRVASEVKKVLSEYLLRGTLSSSSLLSSPSSLFGGENASDDQQKSQLYNDKNSSNNNNHNNIATMIAITDVTISADLQHAKVFVASISPAIISSEACIDFLEANMFRLRAHVGTQIRLKHVPELKFFIDDSMDKAERIENLLKALDIPK